MTAQSPMDVLLPFGLKKEQEESIIDDADDDISLEDINNLLSMPLPALSANKLHIPSDGNDEFLRLTTMVRAVYFSYLHKCLLTNYILCYKEKNQDIPCSELKKCVDQMELNAVRSALEATLYRQHMLKLISDVKSHTSERKAYKKLVIFLETPPSTIDVGVQTNNLWSEVQKPDNIQSVCITSNCEELFVKDVSPEIKEHKVTYEVEVKSTFDHPSDNETTSPIVNSTCYHEVGHDTQQESDEEISDNVILDEEMVKDECTIFDDVDNDPVVEMTNNESIIKNENENSQDSLLQHMEDMFCESDDSSDLMTLIEKHSGVTKANVDKEITQMCLETDSFFSHSSNPNVVLQNSNTVKTNTGKNIVKPTNTNPGRYSFSYYKEMKSREANKLLPSESETVESKQKRRANSIWFVERVHQMSRLKSKMTELALKNYRRHGRVKEKFVELFGESDDEEMMPDSPICIEEHLTACKERIAPWIVQHLMPFYKKRRIKDKKLFKMVAKHIADMLILENTFPEQDCVSKYIETYFKNKKLIKSTQDIYL